MKLKKIIITVLLISIIIVLFFVWKPWGIDKLNDNFLKAYNKLFDSPIPEKISSKGIENNVVNQVKVEEVKYRNMEYRLPVVGSINFKKKVEIKSLIKGRVEKIFVKKIGVFVRKNQELIKIDDRDLRLKKRSLIENYKSTLLIIENSGSERYKILKNIVKAKAAINQCKENLKFIVAEYENKKKLYEIEAITSQEVKALALERYKAVSELLNAKLGLLQLNKTMIQVENDEQSALIKKEITKIELDKVNLDLERTVIKSPIDGIIAIKEIEEGEIIEQQEKSLFAVIQLEQVYLEVEVSENDLSKIQEEQRSFIKVDAFSKLTFEGRIKKINPIVNPKSRTCNISILIDNKDLILKPGMFARGYVIVDVKPECLSFNKLALIADETTVEDDIRKIFIVKDGYAISKKVRIGIECGENIEIIGDIAPGELVVVDGQNKLTDFVKVFYKMNKNND